MEMFLHSDYIPLRLSGALLTQLVSPILLFEDKICKVFAKLLEQEMKICWNSCPEHQLSEDCSSLTAVNQQQFSNLFVKIQFCIIYR